MSDAERYAYFPPGRSGSSLKVIGGVLLYGAMLSLLYATFVLIRASRRQREHGRGATRVERRPSEVGQRATPRSTLPNSATNRAS